MDKIPLLNMFCQQYGLSKDTVLMPYNEPKSKGIITSQVGKENFIQNENTGNEKPVVGVCWPLDARTNYGEITLNGFSSQLVELDGLPKLSKVKYLESNI